MSKSFYYDVNENKWKSVRGHDCAGSVWVDDATEEEIRAHLTKIPEIIKAQAEIAALRAENIRLLVRCDEKFDIIDNKDKLIAQMRKALQEAMVLCDAVPTRAHDMAKDYHLREIGRIVNVKGLYHVVKAALSAAADGGE